MRPRHDEIAEEVGELAATYLAREHTPGELDTITALIRGIRDPDLCRELAAAELEVGPMIADGPRKPVIALLNRRKQLLDENPHLRLPIDELGRRDEPRELPSREWVWLDEDGEPYDRGRTADAKIAAKRAEANDGGLAADGGRE